MIYDDQTSSAMNYYEELGVSQEATEQEIRKAHRRLVKLMHPDAQPDQSLKMVAETQMRRLNSIVSTLLDREQRRVYDEQLRSAHMHERTTGGRTSWAGIPWWMASTLGAVALTLVAVWLWADHLGRTYSNKSSKVVVIQPAGTLTPSDVRVPGTSPDPNLSKRVGASYTAPVVSPRPPISESDPPGPTGGIRATVVQDPPAASKPLTTPPVPEPHPDMSKPAIAAATRPAPVKKADPSRARPRPEISIVNQPAPSMKKPAPASVPGLIDAHKQTPLTPAKTLIARNTEPAKSDRSAPTEATLKPLSAPPKKVFSMPPGAVVARTASSGKDAGTSLPTPPGVAASPNRDYNNSELASAPLPTAEPPKAGAVITSASPAGVGPRDPLEGEWVYAPKEPERHRAGFYPPEFIDLKLFGAGDPGSLKGEYSARYVVTDRPVSPEISFELASVSKGSRRFVWQSNSGAKGTLSIDPIDDRTIRVDWHTTSAVHGPALTSGQATLIRRQ